MHCLLGFLAYSLQRNWQPEYNTFFILRTAFRVRSQIQSLCDGTQMIKKSKWKTGETKQNRRVLCTT